MTEPDRLTAVLLQLQAMTQQLADLDCRQANDIRQAHDRIGRLAMLAGSIKEAAADQADTLAAIKAIHERLDEVAARIADASFGEDSEVYQPCPSRRWWKLDGPEREAAIARLRAWVDQIYLPGYGYLAAGL